MSKQLLPSSQFAPVMARSQLNLLSIFIAHNYYRSANPSGENVVFEAEAELLLDKGHVVHKYVRYSDEIASFPVIERAALGAQIIWSRRSYLAIRRKLAELRPDVAHFHNIFPLISTSAFRACRESRVPVILTLHNYRLLCVNGLLRRNGGECENCVGRRVPWPGVLHRCYRDSLGYSAAMAFMQFAQRVSGTWSRDVDLFIAPSEFLRQKYVAAGFDAGRIIVKPNFVNHEPKVYDGDRNYALFVGRLSAEKGVETLLAAWKQLPYIPLIVVGDGPQKETLRASAQQLRNVAFVGAVGQNEVLGYMRRARYLAVPSECNESLSMVTLEAFACGTPVIASKLGALPEVITDGRNGLFFRPRDPCDLACKAAHLWSHPEHARALGRGARSDYETRFSAERNYEQLIGVYAKTLA